MEIFIPFTCVILSNFFVFGKRFYASFLKFFKKSKIPFRILSFPVTTVIRKSLSAGLEIGEFAEAQR